MSSPRASMYVCMYYSPPSVAKGKVEGIGLRGLARFSDQAIRVEGHWVLVYLGIMHEVPICAGRKAMRKKEEKMGHYQMFAMMMEPLGIK